MLQYSQVCGRVANMQHNEGFCAMRHWVVRGKHFDTKTEKLVYIALLDRTDSNGQCFPSVSTLAEESLSSERGVYTALKSLETKCLISREPRYSKDGLRRSTVYHVTTEERYTKQAESELNTLDKTVYQAQESTTTVEHVSDSMPVEPTIVEPVYVSPAPSKREEYPTAFEQLWAIYPKKVAKMAAYKAWRKAKVGLNSAFLMAKVQAFAAQNANTETKYIPNFATWLNGERWNDEYRPDPPQARKPATNAERNMQNLAQSMQSETDPFGFQIAFGVSSSDPYTIGNVKQINQ